MERGKSPAGGRQAIANARRLGTSLRKKRIRKFCGNKLAVFGLTVIVIFLFMAVFAPFLTRYNPLEPNFGQTLKGPTAEHWFGTDSMGRDLYTRVLYGARVSILIAVASSLIANAIGVVLGAFGGYFGGLPDKALVRLSELFACFPQLIIVLIVMAFIGSGTFNLILVFAITGWTGTFRLVRAEYMSKKEETYVKACEAFGMGRLKIIFFQILPSVMTTVIIQVTMNIPGYVMSEAGLSFLGFGVPMSTPTWGTMLNAAKSMKVLLYAPGVWLVPGCAISLFVLAVNFFGDGLRDVMDPRQQ